jgi:hypothetical protein
LGGDSGTSGGGGGFKKAGFKKAGFKSAFAPADGEPMRDEDKPEEVGKKVVPGARMGEGVEMESDTDDEGYEMYDPRHPTD